jgi:hypothetical protein
MNTNDPKFKLNLKHFWENWFQNCFFIKTGLSYGQKIEVTLETWNNFKDPESVINKYIKY